jgi:hypothetical protein
MDPAAMDPAAMDPAAMDPAAMELAQSSFKIIFPSVFTHIRWRKWF